MKTAMVLTMESVLLASIAFGDDPRAREERHKAKYGRYTAAEEKRLSAMPGEKNQESGLIGQACCRGMATGTKPRFTSADAWHRAKLGRNTAAYEAARMAAETERVAHVAKCAELARCPVTKMPAGATSDGPALLAATGHSPCEEPCCRKGE
jgi:membrane protease subunit (stomatin/prohibitin family)